MRLADSLAAQITPGTSVDVVRAAIVVHVMRLFRLCDAHELLFEDLLAEAETRFLNAIEEGSHDALLD